MFGPIEFILAGVLVGFCVGVTGVGGGSLMTPILISLFRIEPHIAIGTDLLYAAISKFCGSFVHAKKMNIVWPIVIWLAVGSIPASFATHWVLENYLSQSTHYKAVLTMVLGFMLTITGLSILFRTQIENLFNKYRKQELPDMTQDLEKVKLQAKDKRVAIIIMGIILGIFVTLSSVGAGAFGIMALVVMFPNLPMIRIIGSDVVHAVLLTLVAGLGHMSSGNVDFMLLMWLLVGSIPAIIVGTLLSSRMPEKLIRKILGITLFALGVNFMINPVKSKPAQPAETAMIIVSQNSPSV
ncbi:sulfite exporter TauE/SafE family protein [Acinetobacter lwoffii]|uniref:sulfite exporter TauE/SafE family protein n=1 Tax=Acinetobacter lwoffii TaxID=28090 RepID=UPI001FF2A27D|nr:sulfite exporter TauE/SafE family protein [Acinetobacter lwoffii]MCJ8513413.1 sulfite exporter TauE/SafE family protein [Acinetobacter lwoffii]